MGKIGEYGVSVQSKSLTHDKEEAEADGLVHQSGWLLWMKYCRLERICVS